MPTPSAQPRLQQVPPSGPRESEAARRRYQLARRRIASLRHETAGPFAHLRRTYD